MGLCTDPISTLGVPKRVTAGFEPDGYGKVHMYQHRCYVRQACMLAAEKHRKRLQRPGLVHAAETDASKCTI